MALLGLPRGGVVVAAAVCAELREAHPDREIDLDVILVRKVGLPRQPELAIGAIGEGGVRVVNDDVMSMTATPQATFDRVAAIEQVELERRARAYRHGRTMVPLDGTVAVAIDDGIATGATARAALSVARAHHPARLVLAAPVAAPETMAMFEELDDPAVDDVVVVDVRSDLSAVGSAYRVFDQTSDDEVTTLLDRYRGSVGERRPHGR